MPKELLSGSEELESQDDQAALKDPKVFQSIKLQKEPTERACRESLQRQPVETACRDSLQRQPSNRI